MANTAVTIVALSSSASTLEPAGTAIVAANTHTIDCAGVKSGKILVRVSNTFAGSKAVTFKGATLNPPAFRKDLGDLTITLAAQNDVHQILLETARFCGNASPDQTKIYITVAAAMTGFIWAYQLPDTV